jgi:hypothetical protein
VSRWWHRVVLKHAQIESHVSVPMFDISAKGLWVECSCGKEWAI